MPKPINSRQLQNKKKKKSSKSSTEQDFDKFRHEIYKFGLSGLDKKEQLDARVELAIKLGAKPKKWIKPNLGLGADSKKKNGASREADKHTQVNSTSST